VCLLGAFIFRADTECTEVAQRRARSRLFVQSLANFSPGLERKLQPWE